MTVAKVAYLLGLICTISQESCTSVPSVVACLWQLVDGSISILRPQGVELVCRCAAHNDEF